MKSTFAPKSHLFKCLPLSLSLFAGSLVAEPQVADISGVWLYSETSMLVLRPEDETLRITCFLPDGEIVINQIGSEISGTLTHYSTNCLTSDGFPVPPPWSLPYEAFFTGHVTGYGLHIDQFDAPPAPPVHCPKQGSIEMLDGNPVAFSTTGRCDLSAFPFPFSARNRGEAVRP